MDSLARFDTTKDAVGEIYIINHGALEAGNPHDPRTGGTPDILDRDVSDDWAMRAFRPGFIEEIYGQDCFGYSADLDVAHVDILDHPAP